MAKVDIEAAESVYNQNLDKLFAKYGGPSLVPQDEWHIEAERLRAAYAIELNPEVTPSQVFKTYSVDPRVWKYYVDGEVVDKLERRMSRAEKVSSVLSWASEHVGETFTTEQLMNECEISYTMAKKLTEDRPDVFRRVKRGHFELRDPDADRKADKAAQPIAAVDDADEDDADQDSLDVNDDVDNDEGEEDDNEG